MRRINRLNVYYHDRKVGTMAPVKKYLAAFEYDKEWLAEGFSVSPFSLPLRQEVYVPKPEPFEGIFGVFADCLPDGWGRLLVDRFMLKNEMNPSETGNLTRLALVGRTGMGALTFEPDYSGGTGIQKSDFDQISEECGKILREEESGHLDELFALGGSSGGARPKILTKLDGEDWIVKFPSSEDGTHIGRQEYEYGLCAKECGIKIPEIRLLPSKTCDGYFGVRRFDRRKKKDGTTERIHMISVSALLETSHRIPNLDYDLLMRLTLELTKDFTEVEKMFRLMCFNVFAHNRDDHSKNFSYLYEENEARWVLSPAYDLTYSYSIGGEHATTVHGNGRNPGMKDILESARAIGIKTQWAKRTAEDIYEIVNIRLGKYLRKGL